MNRPLPMILSLLLTPAFAQQVATESTILFDKRQRTIITTAGPVRWNFGSDGVSLPFRSSKLLGIKSIDLKLGSQSMIDLRAIYADGTKLMLGIARVATDACLDEYGGLNDKCFIDLALYDFNRDGISEVVLSIGDGMIEQKVYIAQYRPPLMKEDRSRGENWTSQALDGQSACFISGETISFRVGSRGFTDTYFFRDGKFYFKGF